MNSGGLHLEELIHGGAYFRYFKVCRNIHVKLVGGNSHKKLGETEQI